MRSLDAQIATLCFCSVCLGKMGLLTFFLVLWVHFSTPLVSLPKWCLGLWEAQDHQSKCGVLRHDGQLELEALLTLIAFSVMAVASLSFLFTWVDYINFVYFQPV